MSRGRRRAIAGAARVSVLAHAAHSGAALDTRLAAEDAALCVAVGLIPPQGDSFAAAHAVAARANR